MTTLYDFTVSNQANQLVSLQDYKGKVVLIVNTATGCGLTPQYQGLQELYDKGTPVLEEDGRAMWFMGVSWKSIVGQPWIPAE